MAGLAGMIISRRDEIVLRPKRARRLAKNLAHEPQGEVECAPAMRIAFTRRSENILTE
jgi:hypothetical protein